MCELYFGVKFFCISLRHGLPVNPSMSLSEHLPINPDGGGGGSSSIIIINNNNYIIIIIL